MELTMYTTRLGLAFLFGLLIGAERQFRLKNAGLRTNTLVALGSAVFILLSISLTDATGDPSRIASQIVTGVGFLGGGLILKDGMSVRGLNTAAT
ncbi:MAG: MgtC/SapB family protein, partial [Tannerellaceae bacterium]|nr:MgtC/SapB family protein [Tannerellaceae bacterium]